MRESIRLPADVQLSTQLLSLSDTDLEGAAILTIEALPNGKFNRVTKITITLPSLGEVIVIVPKEKKL